MLDPVGNEDPDADVRGEQDERQDPPEVRVVDDRAVRVDEEPADEHERERVGLVPQEAAHHDVEPGQCRDDPQRDPYTGWLGVAVGGVLQADERVVRPDEHEADADGGRDRQGNDPCTPVEAPMDDDGAEHDDRPHAGERMRQRHGRETGATTASQATEPESS